MGTLSLSSYTIPIPENATIKNGIVSWKVGKKMKTGKLSGTDKVLCQSEIWIAQFVDENGKLKRVSTKTKDKSAANRVLVKYENEVSLIRAGLTIRSEVNRAIASTKPIKEFVDKYEVKMVARGNSSRYIELAIQRINTIFDECKIDCLSGINRNIIDQWIALEIEKGARTPSTINTYVAAISGFLSWCVESKNLTENPLGNFKKLNEAVGRKKQRRSLTEDELKRLFETSRTRKYFKTKKILLQRLVPC